MGKGSESAFGSAAADVKGFCDLIPRETTGPEAGNLEGINFDARPAQRLALLPIQGQPDAVPKDVRKSLEAFQTVVP